MATIIAFHAHPDDEVLLTGGTLARLAAEGNRVIVVMAADGVMGPATGQGARHRRGVQSPVRDHASGGRAPLRVAETRGSGRSPVLCARPGEVSAPGQGDAGAARAYL